MVIFQYDPILGIETDSQELDAGSWRSKMPEIHFRWWFFNKRTVVLFWKNHQLGKITITWEMCGLFSLFSQLQQQNTTNVTDEHQHFFCPGRVQRHPKLADPRRLMSKCFGVRLQRVVLGMFFGFQMEIYYVYIYIYICISIYIYMYT